MARGVYPGGRVQGVVRGDKVENAADLLVIAESSVKARGGDSGDGGELPPNARRGRS